MPLGVGQPALAELSAAVEAAGDADFKPLFNGKDTTGWKLRNPAGNNCWVVEEGILKNLVPKGAHGTDLLTGQKYWNFAVRFEFQVPDGANSGFYLRGRHEIEKHRASAEAMMQGEQVTYGTVFRRVREGRSMAELRTDGVAGCLRTPRGGSGRQIQRGRLAPGRAHRREQRRHERVFHTRLGGVLPGARRDEG